jgi:hypothetical protein
VPPSHSLSIEAERGSALKVLGVLAPPRCSLQRIWWPRATDYSRIFLQIIPQITPKRTIDDVWCSDPNNSDSAPSRSTGQDVVRIALTPFRVLGSPEPGKPILEVSVMDLRTFRVLSLTQFVLEFLDRR